MPNMKVEDIKMKEINSKKTEKVEGTEKISAHQSLINFLKGMIGPGCFSLPLAFKQSGLWTGFALVFIIGILTCRCMMKLVQCSQKMVKKYNVDKSLDYGRMAEECFSHSFSFLQKQSKIARYFVNTCLMFLQLGILSIYYIFVIDHAKEISDHFWPNSGIGKTLFMIIGILPFILITSITNMHLISHLSMIGNVFMIVSVAIILVQLFSSVHVLDELEWITDIRGIVISCGSIMYAFEGQAMVLPLENRMKHPIEMRGLTGVLSTGISLVTIVYAACGFYGYITYGKDVQGSVTLNMDDSGLNLSVKILLLLVVYLGYLLQMLPILDFLHPFVHSFILKWSKSSLIDGISSFGLRYTLVFISFVVALSVPNLEDIIPLVGVTAGMLLALIIPSILHISTFLPLCIANKRIFPIVIVIVEDLFFFLFGCFLLIAGLESNIVYLISKDK